MHPFVLDNYSMNGVIINANIYFASLLSKKKMTTFDICEFSSLIGPPQTIFLPPPLIETIILSVLWLQVHKLEAGSFCESPSAT